MDGEEAVTAVVEVTEAEEEVVKFVTLINVESAQEEVLADFLTRAEEVVLVVVVVAAVVVVAVVMLLAVVVLGDVMIVEREVVTIVHDVVEEEVGLLHRVTRYSKENVRKEVIAASSISRREMEWKL